MVQSISSEERFGLAVTAGVHLLMLVLALLLASRPQAMERTAFIEVTLGEFQDGTVAEHARQEEEPQPAQPEPVTVPREEPEPEPGPDQVVQPEPVPEEATSKVELPEQDQEIDADILPVPERDDHETELQEPAPEQQEPSKQETTVHPDESEQDGEQQSGRIRGSSGRVDADHGSAADPIRSAPFQLEWEGEINRAPLIQPLPEFVTQTEAVISIRFEVRPDGSVGRLQPLIKAHPELEREVLRTLRTWRFSELPAHLPRESQFGTITFRFVLE